MLATHTSIMTCTSTSYGSPLPQHLVACPFSDVAAGAGRIQAPAKQEEHKPLPINIEQGHEQQVATAMDNVDGEYVTSSSQTMWIHQP